MFNEDSLNDCSYVEKLVEGISSSWNNYLTLALEEFTI